MTCILSHISPKANGFAQVCQWCTAVALGPDYGLTTPGWETWAELKPTLAPFLATQVTVSLEGRGRVVEMTFDGEVEV